MILNTMILISHNFAIFLCFNLHRVFNFKKKIVADRGFLGGRLFTTVGVEYSTTHLSNTVGIENSTTQLSDTVWVECSTTNLFTTVGVEYSTTHLFTTVGIEYSTTHLSNTVSGRIFYHSPVY